MYCVGLTGGIASGKSTVSALLSKMGARLIDADVVARSAVAAGSPAWQAIVERFGQEILLQDGSLNRGMLGGKIFAEPALRNWLDALTHPAIRQEIFRQMQLAREEDCRLLVLDIPLLIEAGWREFVDEVWVVYVRPDVQLNRLMERNILSREQALQRIQSQMSLEEKVGYADLVIDNNAGLEELEKQVSDAWRRLQNKVTAI
ncbi:dephospho-CoA kinase [Propionispora hippei]|uniref:Dephospho-CoA kinase n=1 Tax=Propionispora hippei DSM 15287 TaxID=1123003 RepID=A0A1M6CQE7_9FIRM|nr:dephospho-CoA kinase [Propionispora hippei]SHI63242.1 dephospho-CoA kinase [Propionispora hippei DSM 15287]